jgi:Ni/Co efflux regulator RcnB
VIDIGLAKPPVHYYSASSYTRGVTFRISKQRDCVMTSHIRKIAVVTVALFLAADVSFAHKFDSPGNSGNNKAKHHLEQSAKDKYGESSQRYFSEDRYSEIKSYYSQHPEARHCPPGLAKKNNGCQAPGQAKKWRKGQSLPSDLVYYDLPGALLNELGRTPEGQKIVRVDTDILLISIATGEVIDAFEDLF